MRDIDPDHAVLIFSQAHALPVLMTFAMHGQGSWEFFLLRVLEAPSRQTA